MKHVLPLVLLAACSEPGSMPPPDACSAEPHPIFLDRGGGTYVHGDADDSSTNASAIIEQSATLPAPVISDSEWTNFVDCVAANFSPFAVTVTDIDPGAAVHTEVVVVDSAERLGQTADVASLVPVACAGNDGKFIERAIGFLAWDRLTQPQRCATATQLIGHSMGLDTVTDCADLMALGCPDGQQTFTDANRPCGGETCFCGAESQNSFQHLLAALGPSCP